MVVAGLGGPGHTAATSPARGPNAAWTPLGPPSATITDWADIALSTVYPARSVPDGALYLVTSLAVYDAVRTAKREHPQHGWVSARAAAAVAAPRRPPCTTRPPSRRSTPHSRPASIPLPTSRRRQPVSPSGTRLRPPWSTRSTRRPQRGGQPHQAAGRSGSGSPRQQRSHGAALAQVREAPARRLARLGPGGRPGRADQPRLRRRLQRGADDRGRDQLDEDGRADDDRQVLQRQRHLADPARPSRCSTRSPSAS